MILSFLDSVTFKLLILIPSNTFSNRNEGDKEKISSTSILCTCKSNRTKQESRGEPSTLTGLFALLFLLMTKGIVGMKTRMADT